jgi:transcriptional regulator GlxA family with amidase domain
MTLDDVSLAHPPELTGVEPDIRVAFILGENFSLLPFAAFIDSLRHAADEADFSRQIYCRWTIVAEDPELPVRASCGASVMPQEGLGEFGRLNFIVVAGGLLPSSLGLGDATRRYIRRAYEVGISIVGLCTASFLLAELGLLDGKRAAVHHEHRAMFRERFPAVESVADEMFVSDRGVLTCLGGTSALDLAFHLIDTYCGKARAVKGITSLLVDHDRSVHRLPHSPHNQLAACGDRKVEAAVGIMQRYIATPHSVTLLAAKVGCSERELSRLFMKYGNDTPAEAWRNIRLAQGHWLLLNSNRAIAQIANECGFSDAAHFTRWFKVSYKETPDAFRRRRRIVK